MVFKRLVAATASIALMATPALAAAPSAAATARAATTEVAPMDETITDGSQLRGGFIIPLIALIAVILGLCAAFCSNDDDDLPSSP